MELSTVARPEIEESTAFARSRQAFGLQSFNVAVPGDLSMFGFEVRATTLGDPANPPIVVLGGISANCFPAVRADGTPGWWASLVGESRTIDFQDFYVIGVDFAADESGHHAPSTFDQARVLAAALDTIGIDRPATIVGASYGAMVGLALAASEPHRVDRLVVVSGSANPHPLSTAARELQRRVVSLGMLAGRGDEALEIARGMAMLTYRTPAEFQQRFDGGICDSKSCSRSAPGAYLEARGKAFRSVMSPGRFLSLSASIDRHRIDASRIQAPCLVIGAASDQLVLEEQLRKLADELAGPAELHVLKSFYGHDMFLKEAERIGRIIAPFIAEVR